MGIATSRRGYMVGYTQQQMKRALEEKVNMEKSLTVKVLSPEEIEKLLAR